MWLIIISVLVVLSIIILICYDSDLTTGLLHGAMASAILVIIVPIVLSVTTGLAKNYSSGSHVGYIVELKESGVIWKTTEGKLQVGVGKQNAAMEHWKFSVADKNIERQLTDLVGTDTRVVLAYDGWLILPYKMGSSNVLITGVEIVE